jgi:hypothetical protein
MANWVNPGKGVEDKGDLVRFGYERASQTVTARGKVHSERGDYEKHLGERGV